MKKCQRCSKTANLHITELREGEVQAIHLCEDCAKQYLAHVEVTDSPDDADELISQDDTGSATEEAEESKQLACPNCGITFKEFRRQGRLGCPHDYLVFEEQLLPLIESIHEATQHVGRIPKRSPESSARQFQLLSLRNKLREAIDSEQYEEAARIRDEIQQVEKSLKTEQQEEQKQGET